MWATNLKVIAVALTVVLFYTMVAHLIPQLQSAVPEAVTIGPDITPRELAAAGERVFNGAGNCASCHGLGTRAPNLLTDHGGLGAIGARCLAALGEACEAYLYSSLTAPAESIVPGFAPIMPDMRNQLPGETEIWALVAFLQSQGGEITVTPERLAGGAATTAARAAGADDPPADASDARALLQANGCLGCHQLDGRGPTLAPPFDGVGRRLSPDEIRRSILEPNAAVAAGYEQVAGLMPASFGEQLSAAQLETMVRFLAGRR